MILNRKGGLSSTHGGESLWPRDIKREINPSRDEDTRSYAVKIHSGDRMLGEPANSFTPETPKTSTATRNSYMNKGL